MFCTGSRQYPCPRGLSKFVDTLKCTDLKKDGLFCLANCPHHYGFLQHPVANPEVFVQFLYDAQLCQRIEPRSTLLADLLNWGNMMRYLMVDEATESALRDLALQDAENLELQIFVLWPDVLEPYLSKCRDVAHYQEHQAGWVPFCKKHAVSNEAWTRYEFGADFAAHNNIPPVLVQLVARANERGPIYSYERVRRSTILFLGLGCIPVQYDAPTPAPDSQVLIDTLYPCPVIDELGQVLCDYEVYHINPLGKKPLADLFSDWEFNDHLEIVCTSAAKPSIAISIDVSGVERTNCEDTAVYDGAHVLATLDSVDRWKSAGVVKMRLHPWKVDAHAVKWPALTSAMVEKVKASEKDMRKFIRDMPMPGKRFKQYEV